MHKVKVYLIQWEPPSPTSNGQSGTSFTPLPSAYRTEIAKFIEDVSTASGTLGNVYAVDTLYGESEAGGGGEYKAELGGVFKDEDPYPERNPSTCPLPTSTEKFYPAAGEPCISDGESETGEENYQLSEEVLKFINAHLSLPIGLGSIYVMLTPHGVNSCSGFEGGVAACDTNSYCAYHSHFRVENGSHVVMPVIYANMPYDDVPGCETPDQPNHSEADDEINTLSHENNEAVIEPLGEGWYDGRGDEVADKCTYPFFSPAEDGSPGSDAYGVLLGGTPQGSSSSPGSAYNQEIGGDHFLLQREWSNAADGCVQRAPSVKASFVVTQQSETELALNAGLSTTEAGEITEYNWEFSGGDTASGSVVRQRLPTPGEYTVTLRVVNNSGASATTSERVTLQTMRTSTTATTTATTTTTVTASSASTHRTATEIAKLLGLPRSGGKLPGLGSISLGHAECPPACGVGAKILFSERAGKYLKRVQVGSLNKIIAEKGTGSIVLQMTARGKKMLRKAHSLAVTLIVTVEDAVGATWKIERHLTLTSAGKAARRSVAARNRR